MRDPYTIMHMYMYIIVAMRVLRLGRGLNIRAERFE